MAKETSPNPMVEAILRDSQVAGTNLGTPRRKDVVDPTTLFLAHKAALLRQQTEAKSDNIRKLNDARSAKSKRKVSNSVAEAEGKHHEDALEAAAASLEKESVPAKKTTTRRKATKSTTTKQES